MSASSDELSPVEVLVEEFLDRQQRGENPTIGEYCERHPELADELREVFEALAMVEELKPDSHDATGTFGSGLQTDGKRIEQVGDYRILREIGRGGMGVVYEAEQESLRRRVALKVLPRQAAGDEKSLIRFQREARAAARMHHTNIVPVFDVGEDEEHVYYAMQMIQGQALDLVIDDLKQLRTDHVTMRNDGPKSEILRRQTEQQSLAASLVTGEFHQENYIAEAAEEGESIGQGPAAALAEGAPAAYAETVLQSGSTTSAVLPGQSELTSAESNRDAYFRSVAEIGLQTARALSYAHARGIIHRDIKPSNLILDSAGVVWVTDFGLAKTSDEAMTHTGDILGTIRYMSPERFKGECDVRADVYSLGLTLYELLALRPAFASPDRLRLIELVTSTEPPSPRTLDPRIPRDLETIILKSIDKDARRRYQSADELCDDLERFIQDEPIKARRISTIERFARWSRRNKALATSMAVAVVGLVAVTLMSAFYAREQQRFAQEQNELNSELTTANEKQTELYEEQQRLNEERSRMIDELRSGKSRLARKQAEYDLETGNIAEGMSWLAHSLELTAPEETTFRDDVLARLGLAVNQFPRLQTVVSLEPEPEPVAAESVDGRTFFFGTNQAPSTARRSSRDGTHLIVTETLRAPIGDEDPGQLRVRVWDVQLGQFVGRAIETTGDAVYALGPDNERLVVLTPGTDESRQPRGEFRPGGSQQLERLTQRPRFSKNWTLEVREIATGRLSSQATMTSATPPRNAAVPDVSFNADGTQLLVATFDVDFSTRSRAAGGSPIKIRLHRLDAETGEGLGLVDIAGGARAFRFSADGTRIVMMDVQRGNFSRSGGRQGSRIQVRDVETGDPIGAPIRMTETLHSWLACSADAGQIAGIVAYGGRPSLVFWDVETGAEIGGRRVLPEEYRDFRLLDVSPDRSQWIVAATRRETVAADEGTAVRTTRHQLLIGDSETGGQLAVPTSSPLRSALLGRDGRSLVAIDQDTLRMWELPGPLLQRAVLPNLGPSVPKGGSGMGDFRLFTLMRSGRVEELGCAGYDRNDDVVMVRSGWKQLNVSRWNRETGRMADRQLLPTEDLENPICLAGSGQYLATLEVDASGERSERGIPSVVRSLIRCRDLHTGEQVGQASTLDQLAVPLALSDDGQRIALYITGPIGPSLRGGGGPTANGRPPQTGGQRQGGGSQRSGGGQRGRPSSNPDGSGERPPAGRQAGTNTQVRFHVYDTATGQQIDLPQRMRRLGPLRFAQFLEDGSLVVGNLLAPVLLRWRESSGTIEEISLPETVFADLQFDNSRLGNIAATLSTDGRRLAISSDRTTVNVWDLDQKRTLGSPLRHGAEVNDLAFSADGQTLLTACADGLVRQWSLPEVWSGSTAEVVDRVASLTGQTLDAAGRFHPITTQQQQSLVEFDDGKHHEQVETLNPLEQRAITDRESGQWAAADAGFRQWIERRPDEWLPHLLRVQCLVELAQYEAAEEAIEAAAERLDEASVARWLELELASIPSPRSLVLGGGEDSQSVDRHLWYVKQLLLLARSDEQRTLDLLSSGQSNITLSILRRHEPDQYYQMLDELIELAPENTELLESRAEWRSDQLDWDGAIADLKEIVRIDPTDHYNRFRLAGLLLHVGQDDAYRELARDTIERWEFSTEPRTMERTAKMCLISPDLDADLLPRLAAMAQRGVEDTSDDTRGTYLWHDLQSTGMAAYREGGYAETIEILDEIIPQFDAYEDFSPIYAALGQLFSAMSHHHLGDHEESVRRFEAAVDRIDRHYCSTS